MHDTTAGRLTFGIGARLASSLSWHCGLLADPPRNCTEPLRGARTRADSHHDRRATFVFCRSRQVGPWLAALRLGSSGLAASSGPLRVNGKVRNGRRW